MKRTRLVEGQATLALQEFYDGAPKEDTNLFDKEPQKVKVIVQRPALTESATPSVTFHKGGGGKIVITPNDIRAAVALIEINDRLSRAPIKDESGQEYMAPLLHGIDPEDFETSRRCWSLFDTPVDQHPLTKLMKRYDLEVNISPSLGNWVKKEKRRLKRETTPFLLPDYKDERPLFEKVEAGMILNCIKTFTFDKLVIFTKGNRYQVVDTARGQQGEDESKDGMIKINKTPIGGNVKITLDDLSCFPWTVFSGDLEEYFHYEEKIIYDPKKCLPAQYPDILKQYENKLKSLNLELYEHVNIDAIQEAAKGSTLNGKLMRMGKTSESIVIALLWGSKRVAVVSPRNARIFTVKEFERLGIKNYVVVNELADLEKPGQFYLLTYSWLKTASDPHKKMRGKGLSYLDRTHLEKKEKVAVRHECPFCNRALERLEIVKTKSADTGFLLEKTISWTTEGGYICRNQLCPAVTKPPVKGATWAHTVDTKGKIYKANPIKLGSKVSSIKSFTDTITEQVETTKNKKGLTTKTTHKFADNYVGYIDWGLMFHNKQGNRHGCKATSIKGRYCHECKQADSTWVPAPYKRKVRKLERNKKVHVKDLFGTSILDEIHNTKSYDSQIGKAARSIRAKRRIGLTGTLMPNTPADAFWPLHYIFKGGSAQFPYHDRKGADQFYKDFCEYIMIKRGKGLADSRKMLPYLKNPIKFWELMSSKMVRRNYEDPLVKSSLEKAGRFYPNIEFHRIESTMVPEQAALMVAAINTFETNFNNYANQTQAKGHLLNQAMVIGQMVHLRIGATCPEHFNIKMAKLKKPPIYNGPLGGGKMLDIQNIVATKTSSGEKVVILSDIIEMRRTLAKELIHHNPIVFDGTWDDEEREEAFDTFQNDPTRKVFIGGTRQVREGTNLSAANTVICCDLLWEPGLQQQAWSRAFTPTSEPRTCEVYICVAKGSIDEHVFNTFYAKVAAAEQALDRKAINKRAHQIDLRWFVDRVIADREYLMYGLKEEGEKGIMVAEKAFQEIENREV